MKRIILGLVLALAAVGLISTHPSNTFAANSGTLVITLPAKELITPAVLRVGTAPSNYDFTFNAGSGQFTPTNQGPYSISVATHDSGRSLGYTITISGFQKGGGQLASTATATHGLLAKLDNMLGAKAYTPPPAGIFALIAQVSYPYRLTLAEPLTKAEVTSFANFAQSVGNSLADTYIGDGQCVRQSSGTNLCIRENVAFQTTEHGTTGPLYLIQALPLGVPGGITIQGNAAAPGTLGGFNFSNLSNAFAIGGTIPGNIPNATKQLTNYIQQNTTKFSWTNSQAQLQALFAKRTTGTTYASNTFNTATWNLNSASADPTSSAQNTFSTPPEGKLWNVNGPLTFVGNTVFNGSGTIAVSGDVTFNGTITCTPGTRLGVMSGGSITFKNPAIGCGAYAALGNNITFGFTVPGGNPSAKGIFVARNSINLPALSVGASYNIGYDNLFAGAPTTLYQQLLSVVFSTTP